MVGHRREDYIIHLGVWRTASSRSSQQPSGIQVQLDIYFDVTPQISRYVERQAHCDAKHKPKGSNAVLVGREFGEWIAAACEHWQSAVCMECAWAVRGT